MKKHKNKEEIKKILETTKILIPGKFDEILELKSKVKELEEKLNKPKGRRPIKVFEKIKKSNALEMFFMWLCGELVGMVFFTFLYIIIFGLEEPNIFEIILFFLIGIIIIDIAIAGEYSTEIEKEVEKKVEVEENS